MIRTESLTKDYGNGKGVFNLSLEIPQGEVFGFLGPNGAGKTTTLRMLLGFVTPDKGKCYVNGLESVAYRRQIMSELGYLPAEVNFFDGMSGMDFLTFSGNLHGLKSKTYRDELIDFFELDTSVKLSRMSKGMKQKVAIVAAFMGRPSVLVLDEPTSGLDPLMQRRFNELVLKEKERGATILLSSHNFEEIERTCDRIGIIKKGQLVTTADMENLTKEKRCRYSVRFASGREAEAFCATSEYECMSKNDNVVTVSVTGSVSGFVKTIAAYEIAELKSVAISLEELFMNYYK